MQTSKPQPRGHACRAHEQPDYADSRPAPAHSTNQEHRNQDRDIKMEGFKPLNKESVHTHVLKVEDPIDEWVPLLFWEVEEARDDGTYSAFALQKTKKKTKVGMCVCMAVWRTVSQT